MSQDALELRVAFGVELLDPITSLTVSRDVHVTLQNDPTPPLISASGRFAWLAPMTALPSAVLVRSSLSQYADHRYPLQFTAPRPLFRLPLVTTVAYPFAEVTLVRGRLVDAGIGIAAAELRLRWMDWVDGAWQEKDGPRCVSSHSGHFAAALPLPPRVHPKLEQDRFLSVRLVVERRDLGPAPEQRIGALLADIRESQANALPADIIWSQL